MTQYSQHYELAELAAIAAAVTGGTCHLGQGDINIITETVLPAALAAQEATYEGYAAKTLGAPGTPFSDGQYLYSIQLPTIQFDYVDAAPHTTNQVTFAWILDAAGNLVMAFSFVPPGYPMVDNLSAIPLDLKFTRSTRPSA